MLSIYASDQRVEQDHENRNLNSITVTQVAWDSFDAYMKYMYMCYVAQKQ
jgi:hypothetical protein